MQEGSATKGVKPVAAATATKPVRTAQELCAGIPHEIIVMRAQQPNYIYLCRFYAPPSLAPHGLTSKMPQLVLLPFCAFLALI